MVSTFHGLELGKRGLAVTQANITTTGQNIANANTKGYSRQQVNSSASPSLDIWTANGTGQLGTGVSLDSITRVRDRFLDSQYRDQASNLGKAAIEQDTYDRLEMAVNEPSDTGLRSAMDQVEAARQDLANDPDSPAAKAVLKERAAAFLDTAKSMNKSMDNIKGDLNLQLDESVAQANDYLKQIAELNKSIKANGSQSNDLKDKRDVLVEELAKLLPIEVKEVGGMYTIKSNGASLVDNTTPPAELTAASITKDTGGKLGGIVQSLENVGTVKGQLETMVSQFQAETGDLISGDGIDNMSVNPNFTDLTSTAPAGSSAKGLFQSLVSELGAKSQASQNTLANNEAALLATDSRRQSVTGVSLDEEMANLIMYQHSYSAAARLVSMTDQMLDTIINRMAN
ncbi:flagellar hook-associated protein FlgK [Planococcus sp. YIM B11945]|uniref:flagellar hook-associated protein FlgK n=1 Tax=Planococcus sp. YIM B11945 TaxID=3435410 RepID=UPI003D7CAB27